MRLANLTWPWNNLLATVPWRPNAQLSSTARANRDNAKWRPAQTGTPASHQFDGTIPCEEVAVTQNDGLTAAWAAMPSWRFVSFN
jgi:hypothetical protein